MERMEGKRPRVVSHEWLNTTAATNDAPLEAVYKVKRAGAGDQDDLPVTALDVEVTAERAVDADTEHASSHQQLVDVELKYSDGDSEPMQADTLTVGAEKTQQTDDGFTDATASAAEEQQDVVVSELEAEQLKPGWSRKRKKTSEFAEDNPTTSLADYEKDKVAEARKRKAGEAGTEVEDDVDMVAADDESSWVDEDGEEAKRERKKAVRRYVREKAKGAKKARQPPINHNGRNEPIGMVRFEPDQFDESQIDDSSERHALLSPLTEDESGDDQTESGSSSEFECSDEEKDGSSGGSPSSSSNDEFMSEVVDDRWDDRAAQRKNDRKRRGKGKQTKVVRGASRGKRVRAKTRSRSGSVEDESDREEVEEEEGEWAGLAHALPRRPTGRASATRSAKPHKRATASAEHVVAAQPPATRPNTIAFSALTAAEKNTLIRIAKHVRGFTLQSGDDDTASHVLVNPSTPTRTKKVLFGIARGSWIIDRQWLLEYVGPDGLLLNAGADGLAEPELDKANYEVDCWPGAKRSRVMQQQGDQQTPLVFDRREMIFVADRTALPRSAVEQLVLLVGGQPVSDYFACQLCLCADDFVVADISPQVVGLSSAAFPQPIVTTEWLYDCISEGGRKPLDGYMRYTHPELNEEERLQEEAGSPAV